MPKRTYLSFILSFSIIIILSLLVYYLNIISISGLAIITLAAAVCAIAGSAIIINSFGKKNQEEREKLLQELENEREWLETIMSQMPSGVSIAEAPSGKLIYHNEQGIKLIRHPLLPTEDYKGYAKYGAMHDHETPYKPEEYPISRALSGETIYGEQMLYRRGDGTFTYFSVNAAPLRDKEGKIKAAISTFEDIGQRKEIETALKLSEERFSAAFRTNPDALVIGQLEDGVILDVNEAFLKMFGWSYKDVIGKSSIELLMFSKPEERNKAVSLLKKQGWLKEYPVCLRDRNGKERIALLSTEMLKSEKGKIFLTTIRDITELKQAEEAIKNSRNNLLDAQKLAKLGNYTLDVKNGNKIEWSDELYEIWEADRNKPIPAFEELWDRIHPEDREELKRVLTLEKEGSDPVETEFRILFPNGRIKYVQIITRLDFDESGNLIGRQGVEIDITERKLAQIELEKTLNALAKSNNELEQFAYIASHDMQEPLRMISSYMSLLYKKHENDLDDKSKQFFSFAIDGAKRMSSLIKGLLAYSRITTQAKQPEPIDLNDVVSSVLKDLQILIEENKSVITCSKLPVVKADDMQMHQLFQNLISNAIKFKDSKIPEISINSVEKGNEWAISVKDNGIGIGSEYYEKIFQIFQRLHEREKYPGTGLGLAICKKIVERQGGKIWLQSEPGKGTTFYFTIPKA